MEMTIHVYRREKNVKITFYLDCLIIKTISRTKLCTTDLKWVQQEQFRDQHCNGCDSFLNGHFAHFKCFTFETVTKEYYQSQKVVISLRRVTNFLF